MNIFIPILAVTVVGLICGIMLVVASKFISVPEDEKFVSVRKCLPGANCGACGFTGCDGYAHALADGVTTETNLCIPGGSAAAKDVADALGLEAQEVKSVVAYVACCGDNCRTVPRYEYSGIKSCAAVDLLYSGDGMCTFGCLGYGDCAAACPQNAISVENGLAHVDPAICIGCGKCAKVCPNALIMMLPITETAVVRCTNHDKNVDTRKACTHGCIGCKQCEKECPADAIKVINNCAYIDYNKCVECGHCVDVCTVGCITWTNFGAVRCPH